MVVYKVIHSYTEKAKDGREEVVPKCEDVAIFEDETQAHLFVERFQKHHQYGSVPDEMWCGTLFVQTMHVVGRKEFSLDDFREKSYWWLRNRDMNREREVLKQMSETFEREGFHAEYTVCGDLSVCGRRMCVEAHVDSPDIDREGKVFTAIIFGGSTAEYFERLTKSQVLTLAYLCERADRN